MDYVFISYSHEDAPYVERLAKSIGEFGIRVWTDADIDYGATWADTIEKRLDESGAVIVVMSENARQSQWVQSELQRAQRKGLPIFPLLLSGDVWLQLETKQYVDVRDGSLPSPPFYEQLPPPVLRWNTRLRLAWGPPCEHANIIGLLLHSGAVIEVHEFAAEAFKALDTVMQIHDIHPRQDETVGFDCRKMAGGTNYSLHAYGIAVAYNTKTNPSTRRLITDMPAAMVTEIESITTREGTPVFGWGGNIGGLKQPSYFWAIVSPDVLKVGVDWRTLLRRPSS